MKMATLQKISDSIASRDAWQTIALIDTIRETETGAHWQRDLAKLQSVLAGGTPEFKIFAKDGNVKLPFLAFSSLPGVGFCPGAGDCLKFCYSFKAHRYPAAYCRQAQNTVLMQSAKGRNHILTALVKFDKGAPIDFRLYVDGDFGSVADVDFWFTALRQNQWLNAYGYSKSFNQLLAYTGEFPSNYRLNLSSGHNHDSATLEAVRALPITRGEFVAVSIGRKVTTADHGTKEHNKVLRAAYGAKAFTCPGKCGTCTPTGHACGSDKFKGIAIIIAVH